MSILELKQAATRLSKREREELHAYLIRLRHSTPESKRTTARIIKMMQTGKRVSAEELRLRSLERRGLIRRPKVKGSVVEALKKLQFPKAPRAGVSLSNAVLEERAEDTR